MPHTTQDLALAIAQERELLQAQRGNLHCLRLQEANHGTDAPVRLPNQIKETEQKIRDYEMAIARLELEADEVAQRESRAERERQLIEAFLVQRANAEGVATPKPLALAICLIPQLGSIKADVAAFIQSQGWTMPVDEMTMSGINSVNDVARLVVGLQLKKQAIQQAGYTELHVFMAGPIMAGVALGGIFDNWKPVKLYHRAGDNTYEYWMPLIGT